MALGLQLAELTGSQNNDAFLLKNGKVVTSTENAGGILGGLSSGMPIMIRVAIKPTPSIAKEQKTVNLSSMENASLSVKGRHDPCVVPKAVPAIEAAVAITLADHMIRSGYIPKSPQGALNMDEIPKLRKKVDEIDDQILTRLMRKS